MRSQVEWCDDLGTPTMGVVMDPLWWADNWADVFEWLQAHGGNAGGGMVWVPDLETRTLFTLRWL